MRYFVYNNLFISLVAATMSWETLYLYKLDLWAFIPFIFSSTLCSYSVHARINNVYQPREYRHTWNILHTKLLNMMILVGVLAAFVSLLFILRNQPSPVHTFLLVGIASLLTFLYSAPNIPALGFLKGLATGKTLYLAFMWTFATTILPVLIRGGQPLTAFLGSRFFLIYAICILFDLRDHAADREKGIVSLPTMVGEQAAVFFFFGSIAASLCFAHLHGVIAGIFNGLLLALPPVLVALLFRVARRSQSPFLYYVILDGLMMLSALLHLSVYFQVHS